MQRIETITTKIRPIKKMFVIDLDNYDSFSHLFLKIQEDVDIMNNLLFVNDDYLWSDFTYDFVERSDPDIILNLSSLEDEKLSSHFQTFTVNLFSKDKYINFLTPIIDFISILFRKNHAISLYSLLRVIFCLIHEKI
jgi:hypothetical protein